MCLAILTSLLRRGVDPKSLAYIKPATQCEAEQPITRFCNRVGIANRAIGPVVFFKGFTRAFLDGEVGTAESLLNDIEQAVADLSRGRSFVLIDGVGYPAVGSICDLSNADVARKLQAPVLFIGKSGVGDAVDSYNLNSVFFEHHGVHVLGGIFNKLPLEGYYSLEACKTAVTQYFVQRKPQELPYGFMPLLDITATEDDEPDISDNITGSNVSSADTDSEDEMEVEVRQAEAGTKTKPRGERVALTAYERQLSDAFMRHVDIDRLMNDVWLHQALLSAKPMEDPQPRVHNLPASSAFTNAVPIAFAATAATAPSSSAGIGQAGASLSPSAAAQAAIQAKPVAAVPVMHSAAAVGMKRSREEVEAEARSKGAKGG